MRLKQWVQAERIVTAALFSGATALYSLEWNYGVRGGVSTVGAERVLSGEVPYRDFWTMYAPGHFYLLALLFRIFGDKLIVERVAGTLISAATVCVCYRLSVSLVGKRLTALVPPLVYLATTYSTGYFKEVGSYPPAALMLFLAVCEVVLYMKQGRLRHLGLAGLATGFSIIFKHDVGIYTALAIAAGLALYHRVDPGAAAEERASFRSTLAVYSFCIVAIVLPVLLYFAIVAGPDMLRDTIVFPLTDFRYSRPEEFPSLIPIGLIGDSPLKTIQNLTNYVNLLVPSGLFMLGVFATGLAAKWRKPLHTTVGSMLSVGFLLHYAAAHVQINTHIITLSVYAAVLAIMADHLSDERASAVKLPRRHSLGALLLAGWLLSLAANPAYRFWVNYTTATAELTFAKAANLRVQADQATTLAILEKLVSEHVQPDQALFAGLHRHDVVIVNDVMIYFLLDRPSATRYHELHPGIADTSRVQREMVDGLQNRNVSLIILLEIFPDEVLNDVKRTFRENLPQVGATDLDEYIQKNYTIIRRSGPYTVWLRTDLAGSTADLKVI